MAERLSLAKILHTSTRELIFEKTLDLDLDLDLVIYFAGATTGYSAKFVLKKLRLGEALKIFGIS